MDATANGSGKMGVVRRVRLMARQAPRFFVFMVAITALKLLLMGLFSSDYQNLMFIPFVRSFLDGTAAGNPYQYYYEGSLLASFPYPPAMLMVESVGGLLAGLVPGAGGVSLFFQSLLFKLPSLAFDFLGLYFLMRLYPNHRKYIGLLYFASPIILYGTYMHGQLDIIPTTLLLGAIYHLTRTGWRANLCCILFLAAAVLTKHHIVAALPILFIYAGNKHGWSRACLGMATTLALCLLGVAPFWGQGYLQTVMRNPEQGMLMQLQIGFQNVAILVPLAAVLVVYVNYFLCGSVNKNLLLSFCGVLFAVFLIFVQPKPGWYTWVVPFITIFFICNPKSKYQNLWVYAGLNAAYLLYYVFFHASGFVDLAFLGAPLDFLKIDDFTLRSIAFTLMAALLVYTTIIMYQFGIASSTFYKRKNQPFIIGVAGNSGAGKTSLVASLAETLGQNRMLVIEGDADHRWARGEAAWEKMTSLDPRANYLYRQALDIARLRDGSSVSRVDYDHDAGDFTEQRTLAPRKYIVVAGLHALYLPQMRNLQDLKIYMDTDRALQEYWKVQRDTALRGYTEETVRRQIDRRAPDGERYIEPQRDYADLTIRYFDDRLPDAFDPAYTPSLSLELTLGSQYDLEPLVQQFRQYGVSVAHDFTGDLQRQTLVFTRPGEAPARLPAAAIAAGVIPQIEEIPMEGLAAPDNTQAIVRLMVVFLIGKKMQE